MKTKTLVSILLALASCHLWAGGDPPTNAVPGQIIVRASVDGGADVKFLCQMFGATAVDYDSDLSGWLIQLPKNMSIDAGVSLFGHAPGVEFAQPNNILDYFGNPNDTLYPSQWNLSQVACPRAWDISSGDSDTVIAVIDSGVDLSHPDLAGKLVQGWDFGENDSVPMDNVGHGTRCAGIAGALTNNSLGIAGSGFNCMILPVKASNAQGQLTTWAICRSLWYATTRPKVKVVSMSFGTLSPNPYLSLTVGLCMGRALLVAAAGNYGNTTPTYPAAYPGVLSVGGSTVNDTRHPGSNYGPWVRVAAPGVNILAPEVGGGYGNVTGTSYAAPLVAGLAGLQFSTLGISGQLGQAYVRETIEGTCVPVGNWVAMGRVDARAMLDYVPAGMIKTTFAPNACQANYGFLISGGPLELAASDDMRTHFRSAQYSGPIHVLTAEASFSVSYPGTLKEIQVRHEASSTLSYTPFYVRLWNWRASRWDSMGVTILNLNDRSRFYRQTIGVGNYVNAAGIIKVGIQSDASAHEIHSDFMSLSTISQ